MIKIKVQCSSQSVKVCSTCKSRKINFTSATWERYMPEQKAAWKLWGIILSRANGQVNFIQRNEVAIAECQSVLPWSPQRPPRKVRHLGGIRWSPKLKGFSFRKKMNPVLTETNPLSEKSPTHPNLKNKNKSTIIYSARYPIKNIH